MKRAQKLPEEERRKLDKKRYDASEYLRLRSEAIKRQFDEMEDKSQDRPATPLGHEEAAQGAPRPLISPRARMTSAPLIVKPPSPVIPDAEPIEEPERPSAPVNTLGGCTI